MQGSARSAQKDRLIVHLEHNKLMRANELELLGIARATIRRALVNGDIERVGRGLYRPANAEPSTHTALAEVSKMAPKAVICLVSALAFHELTDQLPRKVWIAIDRGHWKPKITYPPVRTVRFRNHYHSDGIEIHDIGGVDVKIYSIAKSLADAFRNPKLVDRSVAVECLKSTLSANKLAPAEIADAALRFGAGNRMTPYLEALTMDG